MNQKREAVAPRGTRCQGPRAASPSPSCGLRGVRALFRASVPPPCCALPPSTRGSVTGRTSRSRLEVNPAALPGLLRPPQPSSPGASAAALGPKWPLAKTPLGHDHGPQDCGGPALCGAADEGAPACLPQVLTPSLSAARQLVSWSGGSSRPRAGRSCASSDVTEGHPQTQGLGRVHPRNSPGGQSHVPGVGKPGLDRCPRSLGAALAGHCRTQGPSDLLADTGLVRELCLAVFCAKVDSKPCVWKVRSWDHWHQIAGERQKVSGLGPVVWLLISKWSLIRCARYPKNRLGTAPGPARRALLPASLDRPVRKRGPRALPGLAGRKGRVPSGGAPHSTAAKGVGVLLGAGSLRWGWGHWLFVPFGPLAVRPTASWGLGAMGILLLILPVTSKCPFPIPEERARSGSDPLHAGRAECSEGLPRGLSHARARTGAASALLSSGQHGYECCGPLSCPHVGPRSHTSVCRLDSGSHFSMIPHREWLLPPPTPAIRPSGSVSDPPPGQVLLGEAFSSAKPLLAPR